MLFKYQDIVGLNETETRIYMYIIHNVKKVAEMNIRELSDELFVSTATILRLCKNLGCDGFADFQKRIKEYKDGRDMPDPSTDNMMIANSIRAMGTPEFEKKISEFVEFIREAKTITFMGLGNNQAVAEYGARYFSNVGYYANVITDCYYPAKITDNEGHVIVVVSQSGETVEMISQIKVHQEYGSTVLSITNNPNSTIAELSDCSISSEIESYLLPQTYNLTSVIPMIYVIERVGIELLKLDNRMIDVTPSTIATRIEKKN